MVSARFSPDGRRILTVAEFNVRLDIWSLTDKSQMSINYPKYADKGISFTSNGFFMALAERHDAKDHIGIYYVGDFTLINHFTVEMFDLQDIQWSKDDTCLIVWDSCLECKFSIYSPNGNLIASHNPYDLMLGIKNVSQSPNGNFLAVGYYDEVCRFYNHLSWKLIMDFDHNQSLTNTSAIVIQTFHKSFLLFFSVSFNFNLLFFS
jgi:WD40 repeat protein